MDPETKLITTIKKLKDTIEVGNEGKLKDKVNWFHQDLDAKKQQVSKEMDPETKLITTIKELKDAIEEGDESKLKDRINWFHQDLDANKQVLYQLHKRGCMRATQTDLILIACRSRQTDILYYLLHETDILGHLADFNYTHVKAERTEAFKYALIWNDIRMVEMLYDYWCGDLHWIGHDINKLTMLGEMLNDARNVCAIEIQQLKIDIHSLITFNTFQQTLYSSISKVKQEEKANMLVKVLLIYDDYSDIEKVRILHEDNKTEQKIRTDLDNNTSEYMKMVLYIKYEFYFRKLAFNVALLLLENWFIIRKQLKHSFITLENYYATNPSEGSIDDIINAVSDYKYIECTLYHFIYRTWEDWRLYLPSNRQITKEGHPGIHEGRIIKNLIITYDKHKLDNGPVLFLERKCFNERLKKFKTLLEKYVISKDPAIVSQTGTNRAPHKKANFLNDNYLTKTMYMSNYYSLCKIIYYIEAIENTSSTSVLMIERVLQVTGEMLKSSDESNHLLDSTKSMLQLAMSVGTVKYLSKLRDFLSKVKRGELDTRIHIANHPNLIFDDQDWNNIKQELKTIKQIINSVLEIYKAILDKSLLENGKYLLDERIKNLSNEAPHHSNVIYAHYKQHKENLFESAPLLQNLIAQTGLTTPLLQEITWICMNRESIVSKINLAETIIKEQVITILPTYIGNIRQTIQLIEKNNENVDLINPQLLSYKLKVLPCNPENNAITDRLNKVEKIRKKNKKAKVDQLLDMLHDLKDFSVHWKAIKHMFSFCCVECGLFEPYIDKDVPTLTKILDKMEAKCKESLDKKLAAKPIKVLNGIAIEKLYLIFEKHNPPRIDLISCLINRVKLLKQLLQYPQVIPLEQHLRLYKHDLKFRLELEMVLADTANVLVAYEKKGLMDKSDKLLRGIDLGNVLDHGNVFLDVIGDVFNPCDLPTALLTKAHTIVKIGDLLIMNLSNQKN